VRAGGYEAAARALGAGGAAARPCSARLALTRGGARPSSRGGGAGRVRESVRSFSALAKTLAGAL
jgi:hypothetical protein